MKKKLSKILGVGVTIALVASLMVIAAPAGAQHDPEIEIYSSLWVTGAATAAWVNTPVALVNSETVTVLGDYSARLSDGGAGSTSYSQLIVPGLNIPLPGITELSFYFNYTNPLSPDYIPALSLHIDTDGDGVRDFVACVTMTAGDIKYGDQFTQGTWGMWDLTTPVVTNYGTGPIWHGTAGSGKTFAEVKAAAALLTPATDAVVLYVMIGEGAWGGSQTWTPSTTYVDDITINDVTYDVEPGYWLEPDIAYNVKTADETFIVMDAFGEVDGDLVSHWIVTKGCGAGEVSIVDGGLDGDNYITVRMVVKGDCHVTADVAGLPNVVSAEKKWGEIYCTELESVETDTNVYAVTETVTASFLWEDCTTEIQHVADDALIDWWLMSIGALAAVEALEAELGDDPCDEDGGCGIYMDDFFSYDIDGSGAIEADEVFDSPRAALLAIYAEWPVADDTTSYIDASGTTHIQNSTNVSGIATATVTAASPTSVLLATLADYPIDKHGQNTVCVQHETFVPPPPPAQVKVPQVRWAGEKIVLEKEWGEDHEGNLVMFALEEGSIGDLIPLFIEAVAVESIVSSDSRTVFTVVGTDGVARVMFKTEQQGQVDVECVLYDTGIDYLNSFDELTIRTDELTVIGNHGFLVYYLAFEEIQWPEMPVLDAGVALDPIPCVSGWFTSNALPKTLRPEAYQDVNGDGIPDFLLPAGRYVLPFDWPLLAGFDLESRPWYDLMDSAELDNVTSVTQLGPWINVNSVDGLADAPSIGPFNTLQRWSLLALWFADATVVADRTVAVVTTVWDGLDLRNTVVPNEVLDWYDAPMSQALGKFEIVGGTAAAFTALVAQDKGSFWPYGVDRVTGLFQSPFYEVEIPSHWLIPAMKGTPMGYMWDSWFVVTDGPYDYWQELDTTIATTDVIEVYGDNHSFFGCRLPAPTDLLGNPVEGTVILQLTADYPYLPAKFPAITSTIEITWGLVLVELNPHFQADKIVAEVDEVVTFDNMTTGGTAPYTKAEWDFDADGVIDETIIGTHAVVMADVTHAYDAPGVYSVRLWMTDTTPTTRYEQRDDYITVGVVDGMKGDFDSDGNIDFDDFVAFAAAYGSVSADANYDVIGDFDDDGNIDFDDFIAFAAVYGYGT